MLSDLDSPCSPLIHVDSNLTLVHLNKHWLYTRGLILTLSHCFTCHAWRDLLHIPGEYGVHVKFNDEHVPESPAQVRVLPMSQDAKKVTIIGLRDRGLEVCTTLIPTVRFLAVSDIYPMFIEHYDYLGPLRGSLGTIWLDTRGLYDSHNPQHRIPHSLTLKHSAPTKTSAPPTTLNVSPTVTDHTQFSTHKI